MFSFVVKYLGFLKQVPLMGLLFDCYLKLWMLFTKPELLSWLEEIEAEVITWPGTVSDLHKYGGIQFNYNGKELGHIHSNGITDILFNRKVKQELLNEKRVTDHHVFKNSGWISFRIRTSADKTYVLKLLNMAYMMRLLIVLIPILHFP